MQCMSALAIALLTISGLSAQATFGLKAGFNSNNVYTTEALGAVAPDFDALSEIHFGAVADLPISGGFSIQPEFLYTTKGFALGEGLDAPLFGVDVPIGVRAETKFRYVEVPLLAKYTFGRGPVQGYVVAGPTFGYATSGQINTRANVLVDIDLGTTDINLDAIDYQRFELGGSAGLGLQAELGGVRAFADVRYNRGFTGLYDVPLVEERVRNEGIALSAGIGIPLQR